VGALFLALALHVAVQARHLQPGELVVVTIESAAPLDRIHVRAFDRDLAPYRVDPETARVLVGIDLDTPPGTYLVDVQAGDEHAAEPLVVQPKAFRTRRLTVDEAFVTPPPSVAERITEEAALLDRTWQQSARERLWTGSFVRPVPDASNSAFGTRSVFNGHARSPHGGADFLSPAGAVVHAPGAGRVAIARDLYFSGNTVVIDHGLGLFSMLAHLSVIDVHEGEMVEPDQRIGQVGATGRVTGPHLHWAVRLAGARIDPLSVLALLGRP
jgi:murein DD-endopeptidase MepM/ murein hydrolase activator NlpD